MGRLEKATALVALLLAASACSGDDDDRGLDAIATPTFADEGDVAVTTSTVDSDTSINATTSGSGPTTTAAAGEDGDPDADSPSTPIESVSFDDPIGDATDGVSTRTPPAWTDLAGASLERQGNAYRLTVRLGGDAPQATNGAETMNIATFFDTDGDGAVEHELWVNVGSEGWGPVWYDDRGNAAPGEASNVTVTVDGNEVQMLFPDIMLDKPDRLRFSLASEYGELAQIGSSFARRDDAPDGDQAVAFP